MNIFIFAAECYCEECGNAIRQRIASEGKAPASPDNERSYDSDQFPKGPYEDGGGEADSPQHCGSGPKCLNALDIGGTKVGCWLGNPLTASGVHYVIDYLRHDPGPVPSLWAKWYKEEIEAEGVDLSPA